MRTDDRPNDMRSWMRWVEKMLRRLESRPTGGGGGGGGVTSVNGDTGPAVVLNATDVGADPAGSAAAAQAASQPLDGDLTTIAGLPATTDNFMQAKAGAWASRTIAQVKTDLGIVALWVQDINDALSSGAGFLAALSGTWAVNAGVFRQSSAATPARITYSQQLAAGSARAVDVECAHISSAGAIRRFGVMLFSNNTANDSLIVYLDSGNGTNWTLKADVDGVTALSTSAALAYTGTGYVRISALCHGSVADIYLNGTFMMTVNALTMKGANLARVGLYTYSCTADFRNLKVWHPYAVPF